MQTPLIIAILNNNLTIVRLLFETNPNIIHVLDSSGLSPLSIACVNGHETIVDYFLMNLVVIEKDEV